MGSTLEERLRYTNTTIFETFPFPRLSDGSYNPREVPGTPAAKRVAKAAEEFDRARASACSERKLGLTKIHNALEAGELPSLSAAWEALNDAVTECYEDARGDLAGQQGDAPAPARAERAGSPDLKP